MGLEKQGGKPTGWVGTLIGWLMNRFHTSLYIDYFTSHQPREDARILDIGCGGGEFLRFLSRKSEGYRLYGLDHSLEMIHLSEQINHHAIAQSRLTLIHGSVEQIPLENESLDLVMACETVQFWPDIARSFSEVFRVLKASGIFLIVNRYPRPGSKWWKMASIKGDQEYIQMLTRAGFTKVDTDLTFKRGWIMVTAKK